MNLSERQSKALEEYKKSVVEFSEQFWNKKPSPSELQAIDDAWKACYLFMLDDMVTNYKIIPGGGNEMKETVQQVISDLVNMTQLKFMLSHPVVYAVSVIVFIVAGYFGLILADKIKEKLRKK